LLEIVQRLFGRVEAPENLHSRVTRILALRVLETDRASQRLVFPNEAELCQQLGVSRTIVREAVKVLADKGMVEVRAGSGTRATCRSEWNLLDPDILGWQAQLEPDGRFLRDLCEVRLAIEPIAAGFTALRASPEEIAAIGECLEQREAKIRSASVDEAVMLNLQFHSAVVAGCHNPMLQQLSAAIREPFRSALFYTTQLQASEVLGLTAYRTLYEAISRRNPLKARAASEEIVGLSMLAVEQFIRSEEKRREKSGAVTEALGRRRS
jgi:GntR family transcriptional regulator, galactonate operon transcriptional repressor